MLYFGVLALLCALLMCFDAASTAPVRQLARHKAYEVTAVLTSVDLVSRCILDSLETSFLRRPLY